MQASPQMKTKRTITAVQYTVKYNLRTMKHNTNYD